MKRKSACNAAYSLRLYHLLMLLGIIATSVQDLAGQDSLVNSKALNIPFRKFGLSIGNSIYFNGLRFNFADRGTRTINGLNFTCWLGDNLDANKHSCVNGFACGMTPMSYRVNGLSIGLFGSGVQYMNGVAFGGLVIGSGGTLNGICLAGIIAGNGSGNNAINGIVISGLLITSPSTINGFALGGLWVYTGKQMNGLAVSMTCLQMDYRLCGIAFTPGYLKAGILSGIGIGGYVFTQRTNGISISLFNRTGELHGLQIGILNYAGNNPRGLRALPLINMHL